MKEKSTLIKNSIVFVILMGIVSLLSDLTHEGARSIYGTFLNLEEVGGNAFIVSMVSGAGEFLGSSLILVTGFIAAKTQKYWLMTLIGYGLNIVAIPLLSLTMENGWIYAICLILLERIGRAIRKPAKSTLVSFAGKNMGEGKTFAWLEFLDQIGAFLGPLFLTFILIFKGDRTLFEAYKLCFLVLGIPGILTVIFLIFSMVKFPHPENLEENKKEDTKQEVTHLSKQKDFIFYIIGICLVAFGFIDFPLVTVHLQSLNVIDVEYLPLAYSMAMLIDAFSALIFGYLYDKIKIRSLIIAISISCFFPIFLFSTSNLVMIIIGIILWGIGMGAQESILKSAVATLVAKENRAAGFGILEGLFGFSWFIGSSLFGLLYEQNIYVFIYLSFAFELLSIVFFILSDYEMRKGLRKLGNA